jgi:hypothetical protein
LSRILATALIVCGTAVATEDGNVLLFDDIYEHYQRLENSLNSRRPRTAAAAAAPAAPNAMPILAARARAAQP